jgi:pyridoxal/pyridoxine/pyridoxamine kinase
MPIKSQVNLEENDIALVMGDDGVVLYVPEDVAEKEGEAIPKHVKFVTALAILITEDERFCRHVWAKWQKMVQKELKSHWLH